ncbi:MAG: MFS transporter [Ahrensia sp.]|nr:MFS transporter [Ahrensia sp.]
MQDITIHDSRYSWTRLAITLAIAIVCNVGMWAVIMVLPAVQAEFGTDRAAASLPYTATMFGFALGNLLIGRAVDRFGVMVTLMGAGVLIAASYFAATYATSIAVLCLIHVGIGLGTAAGFGPLMADISHWFMKRRGIAVAIAASGNYLSGAIWPLLLTGVLIEDGWRGVYVALSLVTLLIMLPLCLLLRRRVPANAMQRADLQSSANQSGTGFSPRQLQILLAVAGFGCCMAMAMPQVHIVALCIDLGFGPAVGAEMLSLMLFGGVASRLLSGVVADWIGGVRTLLIGSVAQCVALFLYLPFDGLVSLYIVSLVFGLSQGGIVPSYAVIVREYLPAREAGARIGFVIMATIIGMAVGGWTSGWIYDLTGSYQAAFLNGIAWNMLNIGIMLHILTKTPRLQRSAA